MNWRKKGVSRDKELAKAGGVKCQPSEVRVLGSQWGPRGLGLAPFAEGFVSKTWILGPWESSSELQEFHILNSFSLRSHTKV